MLNHVFYSLMFACNVYFGPFVQKTTVEAVKKETSNRRVNYETKVNRIYADSCVRAGARANTRLHLRARARV